MEGNDEEDAGEGGNDEEDERGSLTTSPEGAGIDSGIGIAVTGCCLPL